MKALPPYRGVVCYNGLPGSGKSYALVERGVYALRSGRRVFVNAGFEIVDHAPNCQRRDGCGCRRADRYFSLEEILTIPNGSVVLLDEAPVYVNSRKSAEFPRGLLYRLTQVRKDSLEFYYSAMDEMMVDTNLRRVTFWSYHCRRRPLGFFSRTLYPPTDRRRADESPLGRKWLRLKKNVADAYDTKGKVWIPPEVVESILEEKQRGWVPLTDELVDALWSGLSDPERARILVRQYQAVQLRASQEYADKRSEGVPHGAPMCELQPAPGYARP